MTRRAVYGLGLVFTIACTIMTLQSIIEPRWISSPTEQIGLHQRCSRSSRTRTCHSFPKSRDCPAGNQSFCHAWRTVGFLISFSVVVQLATLVSFGVIVAGGVQRRATGWRIISSLLVFGGVVQCAGMAIVTYLYNHDDRFEGWSLDASWNLSTASWALLVITAMGIAASAKYLRPEDDYEAIPDYPMEVEQDEQLQSRISSWNDGYRSGSYQSAYQPSIRSERD